MGDSLTRGTNVMTSPDHENEREPNERDPDGFLDAPTWIRSSMPEAFGVCRSELHSRGRGRGRGRGGGGDKNNTFVRTVDYDDGNDDDNNVFDA